MIAVSKARSHPYLLLLLAAAALVATSSPASAAVDTFIRFEEVATANWRVAEQCPDGSVARTQVQVRAGREFQSPELDDVNTFANVRIFGFDCEGQRISESGTGDVVYTSSPSLQEAHVSGTVTLESGSVATIDVTWEGTGPLQTQVNTTQFDGFVGIFTSKLRDATATGTVTLNGVTVVSGPALSAEIETLEDRNRFLPSAEG